MNHQIQGALFDLDGTLIDTYDLILASFRYATKKVLGRTYPDEVLMQKVGQPLVAQMWDFTDDAQTHETLLRTYRAHNETIHDDAVRAFPGTVETLRALHGAGYRMGVVTSKRHELAARATRMLGMDPFIEFLIGSDDFPAHKPDPGPVLHGCELLSLPPSACMYVGDSPFDLQAGNAAGCATAAALWGMFPQEVLAAESPNFSLKALDQLPELLESL